MLTVGRNCGHLDYNTGAQAVIRYKGFTLLTQMLSDRRQKFIAFRARIYCRVRSVVGGRGGGEGDTGNWVIRAL